MESKLLNEIFNNYYNNYFKKYQDIIDIMNDNKDVNSICNITQKEIANKLDISQSLVSKCLIKLEISDKCIEKLEPGIYKINHTDMKKYGLYPKVIKYIYAVMKYKDFLEFKLEERAEMLKISKDEVIMANGYWVEFTKSF